MMNREVYLEERLQQQIEWYDRRSLYNQRWFRRLQVASILGSATIPFLTGYITEATVALKIAVGVLGLAVAAITAVLGLYKFQENWVEYRTNSEVLKHEKYRFMTGARPYDGDDPFKLLVERVEGMISKEVTTWSQKMLEEDVTLTPRAGSSPSA
jgi:hypothetical protein